MKRDIDILKNSEIMRHKRGGNNNKKIARERRIEKERGGERERERERERKREREILVNKETHHS